MATKIANWSKLRKSRLPITRRLTRLAFYPCGLHAHSPRVLIMYMIDSLMYVCSISMECTENVSSSLGLYLIDSILNLRNKNPQIAKIAQTRKLGDRKKKTGYTVSLRLNNIILYFTLYSIRIFKTEK